MTSRAGDSTARVLFERALAGGAQALGQPIGALALGMRADIVLLDHAHPDFAARAGDRWLDAWVFVAGRSAVKTVLAGGDTVVEGGRHKSREAIAARYESTLSRLTDI
jgi:cytosine/adenosine deaminase-related metal-dependent hydrolase